MTARDALVILRHGPRSFGAELATQGAQGVAMIGDSIRSIIDLLVFRKTQKKPDAEIEEAPSDFLKPERARGTASLALARPERVKAGAVGTPPRTDDIHKVDPRAAEMHAVQTIPLSAYVSFAHPDADFAQSLRTLLERRHEVSAFLKDDQQRSSDYLDRVIPWAIEAADIFIVLLSPETTRSNYLGRELQLALRMHKRIVPVHVEPLDLEAQWPEPFDRLRSMPALHLGEMSIEDVAEETARLVRH